MEDLLAHFDHFLELGGEKTLALGSDWDGDIVGAGGIRGVEEMHLLAEAMARRGYGEKLIRSIFYDNLARLLGLLFSEDNISSTMYSLLAGALSSVIALASVRIFSMGSQTAIITGAIMPLLPGLAITNAIRDTVNGDLVSGVARTAEALLTAIAIAAGVGVVIALWR